MEYTIISKEAFNVAGIREITEYDGGVWNIIKQDGRLDKMKAIAGNQKVSLGVCFGFDTEGYNDNMVAFYTDQEYIDGYDVYRFPATNWLQVIAEGKISDNTLWAAWRYIQDELLDKKVITPRNIPNIEDFIEWNTQNDYCKVVIMIATM